jgi:hypothetical protein
MPSGEELLQVFYPHLEDTVEVLQVQRVLERMNTFLRLMHEGLSVPKGDHRRVDVSRELIEGARTIQPLRDRLHSAFPIVKWALQGHPRALASDPGTVAAVLSRFERLAGAVYADLSIDWEPSLRNGTLLGTVRLTSGRIQPFALLLKSDEGRLVVRCISPVGLVDPGLIMDAVEESTRAHAVRVGAIVGRDEGTYDLTVEEDVLLAAPEFDASRVATLLRRVAAEADALEQVHLPTLDQPLERFEADLKSEGSARA